MGIELSCQVEANPQGTTPSAPQAARSPTSSQIPPKETPISETPMGNLRAISRTSRPSPATAVMSLNVKRFIVVLVKN